MHKKRKICVVLTDKAQLSRLLPLMKELRRLKAFKLQLVVGAGALTYMYGNVLHELKRHGFQPDLTIPTVIDGGGNLGMAKTAALGMLEFATAFDNLKSEMVVVRGDRFEILPIATAVTYLNKVLVHIEGGDRTGSIDESVRHAVTKLAHVHFVTNKESRLNVLRMGEHKNRVFDVGSLDVDFLAGVKFKKKFKEQMVNSHGVGAEIDFNKDYIVVMQNPVTTEAENGRAQVTATLSAVQDLGVQAIWIWPNIDAGSDVMSKKLREWQNRHAHHQKIRLIRYLEPEEFIQVLNNARALVGNSSTGIKECAWLGIPVVNIGSRQSGRLRARNVVDVGYDRDEIFKAVSRQMKKGKYKSSKIYGDGSAAKEMVSVLKDIEPELQKSLSY